MINQLLKIFFLIFLTVTLTTNNICQTSIYFKGTIIDYYTQKSIQSVNIRCFYNNRLFENTFTDNSGNFILKLDSTITRIEFRFVGYLPLKIINIKNGKNLIIKKIQLIEDPFGLIDYSQKPSKSQLHEINQKQKFVKKGFYTFCENGKKFKTRFSRKGGYMMYIYFSELIDCDYIRY